MLNNLNIKFNFKNDITTSILNDLLRKYNNTKLNYNALANTDDGSCGAIIVQGCMDNNYVEYDSNANVAGTCATLIVEGCMDDTKLNYNALANTAGSCGATIVEGCMDNNYAEYSASANRDDGSCATVIFPTCDPCVETFTGTWFCSAYNGENWNFIPLEPSDRSFEIDASICGVGTYYDIDADACVSCGLNTFQTSYGRSAVLDGPIGLRRGQCCTNSHHHVCQKLIEEYQNKCSDTCPRSM